jgi:uncharacterized protein YndB with AHSA1/START domain
MVLITQATELDAPPSTVWALLTDTAAWPRYAPVKSVVVERPGDEDVNGVGQIRAIRTWAGTVREQVTAFEPERRLGYTLLSGAPVRDYRGVITLEASGDGTRYLWEIEFDAAWYLAPLMTLIAKRTVRSTMRGFANELRSMQR